MAARRSPGVLASVPVKRFSRRGWVISQVLQRGGHLPTPHRTPGHANTGTRGQSRTARSWETRPACGWALSCGGRTGVEQEQRAGATHGVPRLRRTQGPMSRAVRGGSGDSRLTLPCMAWRG